VFRSGIQGAIVRDRLRVLQRRLDNSTTSTTGGSRISDQAWQASRPPSLLARPDAKYALRRNRGPDVRADVAKSTSRYSWLQGPKTGFLAGRGDGGHGFDGVVPGLKLSRRGRASQVGDPTRRRSNKAVLEFLGDGGPLGRVDRDLASRGGEEKLSGTEWAKGHGTIPEHSMDCQELGATAGEALNRGHEVVGANVIGLGVAGGECVAGAAVEYGNVFEHGGHRGLGRR